MVVFVTMKSVTTLLALLIQLTLFAQIDTIVSEDQILQKIEIDQPSEPIIRFGKEYINLLGKWCYSETDGNSFVLSKTKDSASIKGCHEISLGYWGFIEEHHSNELNKQLTDKSFSTSDSVFRFHFFSDTCYFIKNYVISQRHENLLVFTFLKLDSIQLPVNNREGKHSSILLIHRQKASKTADLSIDRIFGVEIDSVFYRGEVVQLNDSFVTFHAYFANGKSNDSVYRFLLDSVTNIGYYFAKNPDRFFSKRVRNQPKYEEEIDDFLRVSQCLMVASLSYTLIDGTINFSNNTISDPTFLKIGIANLLVNAAYASFTIIRQFSTITYYNLEYDWQIVPD